MTEDIQAVAAQLEAEVTRVTPLLRSLPAAIASYTAGPNQWSKKMLLGHLIDSAANNHQRFVRTTRQALVSFPAYEQESWVQIQGYQDADWAELVGLWQHYNHHLAFIIRRIPESALAHECSVGDNPPVTLAWLITDYLDHLKHHLEDLLTPANKAELRERIEKGRLELAEATNWLSEAQLLTPNPDTGWTIKDHLAHLAAWEMGIAALLQRQPRWAAMALDEANVANLHMDDLNEIIFRQNKDRSLAEVIAYFEDAHHHMLAAVGRLAEEELFKPYAYFTGGEVSDDDSGPIIGWVIGNTYEHYAEHQTWIEAML
jgi:hypothetical protein